MTCLRCKQSPYCENGQVWVIDPYSYGGYAGGYYEDCRCSCHDGYKFCPLCETMHEGPCKKPFQRSRLKK